MALQVRKHLPAHVETDELVSLGVVGLLDAVRKFDGQRHVKIESYARYRIRGAILDGLRNWDNASRDLRRKNKKAEKMQQELEAKLGRAVDDEEMANALGVSLQKWYRTVNELQPLGVGWLHSRAEGVANTPCDENAIADTRESPFDLCYRGERGEILRQALAGLPQRERTIMSLYYTREMTMKQIGALLRVDESRISQLHSAALGRLRLVVRAMLQRPRAAAPLSAAGKAGNSSGFEFRAGL